MYNIDKDYLNSHKYFDKIKEFMEKEYGGELAETVVIKEEYYSHRGGNVEEYTAILFAVIHHMDNPLAQKYFYIDYKYTINTESGKLNEFFETFKHTDKVYLKSPDGERHIKFHTSTP